MCACVNNRVKNVSKVSPMDCVITHALCLMCVYTLKRERERERDWKAMSVCVCVCASYNTGHNTDVMLLYL